MNEYNGKAKNAFWRAAHNEPQQNKDVGSVSEMIKRHHPKTKPRPPALGHHVDSQSFSSGWNADMKTHKQIALKEPCKHSETVTKQFNRVSDPLDKITNKQRDRGLGR